MNSFLSAIYRPVLVSSIGATLAVAAVTLAMPHVSSAASLYRQLYIGVQGDDVRDLQQYLATDSLLYPQGLVTGYYGALTAEAVRKFQIRHGISAIGRVGPVTLAALNQLMAGGAPSSSPLAAPIISTPTVQVSSTSATVSWTTNENARAVVYYSTSPLITYERENSVDVSGTASSSDGIYRMSHSASLQNLQPNTTYYYLVYTTDNNGNVSVSWPTTFRTTY